MGLLISPKREKRESGGRDIVTNHMMFMTWVRFIEMLKLDLEQFNESFLSLKWRVSFHSLHDKNTHQAGNWIKSIKKFRPLSPIIHIFFLSFDKVVWIQKKKLFSFSWSTFFVVLFFFRNLFIFICIEISSAQWEIQEKRKTINMKNNLCKLQGLRDWFMRKIQIFVICCCKWHRHFDFS